MLKRIAITLAAILALSAAMVRAQEQPPCADKTRIGMELRARYGERQMGVLTMASGLELALWANPQTGTWTMISGVPGHTIVCLSGSGVAVPPPAMMEDRPPEDPA